MANIKSFEKYQREKRILESKSSKTSNKRKLNEAVYQVDDIYKVNLIVDVPQSFINSFVKKAKDTTDKNVRQFMGDAIIAEELVKNIVLNGMDVDKIEGNVLLGGEVKSQQAQVQVQQAQPQVQVQPEVQSQSQVQVQDQVQTQAQVQPGVQSQSQVQVQDQVQTQAQVQQEDFEDLDDDENLDEDEDELPI